MILGETNNLCSKNDNYNASVEAFWIIFRRKLEIRLSGHRFIVMKA